MKSKNGLYVKLGLRVIEVGQWEKLIDISTKIESRSQDCNKTIRKKHDSQMGILKHVTYSVLIM